MDKQAIAYLRYLHGAYNFFVFLLVIYHGSLGLRLRRARRAGGLLSWAVKRHRKLGHWVAVSAIAGYAIGLTVTFLSSGDVLKYPLHLTVGTVITALLISTYFVSRQIKAGESPARKAHFAIGMTITCLYPVQILLGAGMLL